MLKQSFIFLLKFFNIGQDPKNKQKKKKNPLLNQIYFPSGLKSQAFIAIII